MRHVGTTLVQTEGEEEVNQPTPIVSAYVDNASGMWEKVFNATPEVNFQWQFLLADLIDGGATVRQDDRTHEPRDRDTLEILGHQLVIPMTQPLITVKSRKLGYRFACAEAAAILAGDNRVSTIAPYSKAITEFSDDGFTFNGHYGVKYVEQVGWVASALKRDLATRQAVMNVWRERPIPSRDIPCTLSLQWLVRDNLLNCVATMRSSDAWLGVPYDAMVFSMMSAHLALVLRKFHGVVVELGALIWTAGSRHLYRRDLADAEVVRCDAEVAFEYEGIDLDEFDHPDELVYCLGDRARMNYQDQYRWLREMEILSK